ncbi:CHAT domain-containing protein [Lactarius hatsudake]|nr:CHAT domain-containing protein [Lactarius hatsudake]
MATSEFPFTIPQIEKEILEHNCLLALSPRPDPHRPTHLLHLAVLRTMRNELSPQKADLDVSTTHLTEVVLLPFQTSRDVVYMFFQLASILLSRSALYEQPEDIVSSVKYFRFLRTNFQPLETFNIPHYQLTSRLVRALAMKLMKGSDDTTRDMEEMTALTHEILYSGSVSSLSAIDLIDAIVPFSDAVAETHRLDDANQPPELVIQILRQAMLLIPDLRVSYTLAHCLAVRFLMAHEISDYEEATTIADKIVAAHTPGARLTPTQRHAIELINVLVVSRLNLYSRPEYLEDAIHRLHTLICLPSLPDQDRARLAVSLDNFERQRFNYFGITGKSGETPPNTSGEYISYFLLQRPAPRECGASQFLEKTELLKEILGTIPDVEITEVEAAVQLGRTLLPLQHSSDRLWYLPAIMFSQILLQAHQRTNRLDYLDEAIITHRDLRNVSAQKPVHYQMGEGLLRSLIARCNLLHLEQDTEEVMQLFHEVVNDGSAEAFRRFQISYGWAHNARLRTHPSISIAYETAMSLLEETLVFSPTLQIQHFLLVRVPTEVRGLPLDYASYQIETGQIKQAIETLERGRALLWSEMRGLRTSTDQLRAADPALAERFATINRNLETVAMSVAQNENTEIGDGEAVTDVFSRLLLRQRRLLDDRVSLITHIRSLSGLGNFLKPLSFDALNSAATHGPVIVVNQSRWRSDIIILHKDLPPSVIFAPPDFHDRANQLKDELLHTQKEKGLDSEDYDFTLASVLADLYELVGKPVIERLRQLSVPEKSRVWWCPTSAFCSLPLHAMGPIPSDDNDRHYFMDLYICSYTPTLSALIESRKPGSQREALYKPSLLLVAQPETLPGARGEIDVVQAIGSPVTTLVSEKATPSTVVAGLRDHRFVHFVCHGLLETGKPFDASFELHGSNLTLLQIVRSQLPAAEFAFLSACHTAELTEDSIADEGLHLTDAMQFCGFRSVIGTMWAMADTDGAYLSKHFYKSIFSESSGRRGLPHYERSARALQFAVKKLRRKRGVTLERWVNFVHYGA